LQDCCGVEGVKPGEGDGAVELVLAVAEPAGLELLVAGAVGVGVEGDLEVVGAELGDEAELIFGCGVVEEGGEATVAVGGVVDDDSSGWGEAVVAAVAVEAGVVGELFGVVTEVELIVSLEEAAGAEDELGLAIALKACARDDVEDAVGAVAYVGGVAAALDLDVVDVFGVYLCAEVAGDVGIGDLDAVEEPGDLMAAAHVEHVVCDVGAGNVVGDHGEGVGAIGPGGLGDICTTDECGGSDGVDVGSVRFGGDVGGLLDGAEGQLDVEDWCGVGG